MGTSSASLHYFCCQFLLYFHVLLVVSVGISNGTTVNDENSEGGNIWPERHSEERMLHLNNGNSQLKYPLPRRLKRVADPVTRHDLKAELDQFKQQLKAELVEAITDTISEFKGLQDKVEILRRQVGAQRKEIGMRTLVIEAQNKDIKRLRESIQIPTQNDEKDKELAWLKSKFLNSDWDTELHLAVDKEDEDAIKRLVMNGAYINARNKELDTPLIWASFGSDKEAPLRIIKYLIEHGADVYAMEDGNRTFLHSLLSRSPTVTPPQFHELAEYLISKNMSAVFNIPGFSNGATPWHEALRGLEVESKTISLLFRNGVNFEAVEKNGNNILTNAIAGKRSIKLLSDLVVHGVNWRQLNKFNTSLLHQAASQCYLDGVKYFLSLGLAINGVNIDNNTPLHYAAKYGTENVLETVQFFIDNGADVKITNIYGQTPLMIALGRNDMEDKERVVKLLRDSE